MKRVSTQSGIALFIAVLISSAVLAISLSIGNIFLKETKLSISSRESQVAFYAADSGLECARYWDIYPGGSVFASTSDPTLDFDGVLLNPNPLSDFSCASTYFDQSPAVPFSVEDPPVPGVVQVYTVDTPFGSDFFDPNALFPGLPNKRDSVTRFSFYMDTDGDGVTTIDDPCAVVTVRRILTANDLPGLLTATPPGEPDLLDPLGVGNNGIIDNGFAYISSIESRGYNTCNPTSAKRVERAIRLN